MRAVVTAALLLLALRAHAFDVDGVGPGASEADIHGAFPSAYCKTLEWRSQAAERRCDDGQISFAGVQARITFFLRGDVVQGFNLRFATSDQPRVTAALKSRWGAPAAETRDLIQRKGQSDREVYKITWNRADDRATLIWRPDHKRCWLMVSRGDFAEEIYRVR
ncbi:MAG: hypothetical protein AMJ64_07555 [Betaproteobacteria bacterium SG8_39]|nr:MAG: hypothetical protein AMJ64_07555 [Betaproteobacteria bacterium SG8_39]